MLGKRPAQSPLVASVLEHLAEPSEIYESSMHQFTFHCIESSRASLLFASVARRDCVQASFLTCP